MHVVLFLLILAPCKALTPGLALWQHGNVAAAATAAALSMCHSCAAWCEHCPDRRPHEAGFDGRVSSTSPDTHPCHFKLFCLSQQHGLLPPRFVPRQPPSHPCLFISLASLPPYLSSRPSHMPVLLEGPPSLPPLSRPPPLPQQPPCPWSHSLSLLRHSLSHQRSVWSMASFSR